METGETMVTAELVSSVSADTDTSAGETVIIDVDEVEAIVSIGGGSEVHVVLARLVLPVRIRTLARPYVSSGSSNSNGSIGGEGGDEGRVMGGRSSDAEQSSTSGMSRPCIIIVISSLLVLFLNHLV